MSTVDDFLNLIKDEALATAKTEFSDLFSKAEKEQSQLAKDSVRKFKQWMEMRVKGDIDNGEFEALLRARRRVVEQDLNTLEIEVRTRVEKVVVGLYDLVLDKLLGKII